MTTATIKETYESRTWMFKAHIEIARRRQQRAIEREENLKAVDQFFAELKAKKGA